MSERPPHDDGPRRFGPGGGNHAWLLALVALLVLGYVTLDGARTSGPGARGLKAGAKLPPFAVPLAQSDISCESPRAACDANVATPSRSRVAGPRPACAVRGAAILNLCQLTERGPIVLGFLATRGGDCVDAFDLLGGVKRRRPGVQVAVIGIRGDLGGLRGVVRRHRWGFPVGWDRDGILANLYGVAVCPHITYGSWPGRVHGTSLGDLARPELDRRIDAAVAASIRAGWRPPG